MIIANYNYKLVNFNMNFSRAIKKDKWNLNISKWRENDVLVRLEIRCGLLHGE